jgi:SHS2 domain-containing protein
MNTALAGFREVEHTADWELEIWATDLPGLLEQAARGMASISGMHLKAAPRAALTMTLKASDPESLLVKFLSELLYYSEQERIGFDRYQITVDGDDLQAVLEGAELESLDKEIKAVTYHRLAVRRAEGKLWVNVVFDV